MPTQSTTYNTRLSDESLEKRFRDTFRSQGGSELVDDLYASGVIVPVVDFTAAAEGSALRQDLQKAWDFATVTTATENAADTIASTAGFYKVHLLARVNISLAVTLTIELTDGLSTKTIWRFDAGSGTSAGEIVNTYDFEVFLRSGDSLIARSNLGGGELFTSTRQIADVYGNLTNPSGYTSS